MIRVIEFFGGIGACTQALKRLSIKHEIVDYVEIDKYACASYNAINDTHFIPQDISKWDKNIKNIDLIMHGSPCQDFSLAGLNRGGDIGSGTRSSLMYETVRIINKIKPKYVIWENVTNLMSDKHIHNFKKYVRTLNEMGYVSFWKKMKATDFNIPQKRERIITVSILNAKGNYKFPEKQRLERFLDDFLEKDIEKPRYLSNRFMNNFIDDDVIDNEDIFVSKNKIGIRENAKRIRYIDENDSLCVAYPKSKTRRGRVSYRSVPTITTHNDICVVVKNGDGLSLRYITPLESFRLMGFSDDNYYRASEVVSTAQLYKQAGNSIVVDVLVAVLDNLFIKKEKEITIFDFI